MNKIAILMSTYNGSSYICEQIDSLLNQKGSEYITIYIRDDGSKDDTCNILKSYQSKYPHKIFIDYGENVGPIQSFLSLLINADNYDYYAFCDQDDYWMEDKIQVAINRLNNFNNKEPALYCSSLNIVDEELNYIRKSVCYKSLDIKNIMIESSIAGCTMVFNDLLKKEVIKSLDIVNKYKILMHDGWILKLALLSGNTFFDSDSYIKYRQHGNNVVGASTSFKDLINRKMKNCLRSKNEHSMVDEACMIKILIELGLLKVKKTEYIDIVDNVISLDSNLISRLRVLLLSGLYRNRIVDKIIFNMMVLLKMYKKHYNY
ncbi:TPA: glycosyltransferase family 2 protein [Photobacterium damselae]